MYSEDSLVLQQILSVIKDLWTSVVRKSKRSSCFKYFSKMNSNFSQKELKIRTEGKKLQTLIFKRLLRRVDKVLFCKTVQTDN